LYVTTGLHAERPQNLSDRRVALLASAPIRRRTPKAKDHRVHRSTPSDRVCQELLRLRGICRLKDDEEEEDRLRSIQTTADKLLRGERVTGWPKLSEFIGSRVCAHISNWFQVGLSEKQTAEANTDAPFSRDSLNDAGNSERTKRLFGSDLMYVTQLRRFFCWDGVRWVEDHDSLKTRALCLDSVNDYLSQVTSRQIDTFDNEKVVSFAQNSRSSCATCSEVISTRSILCRG
jgi:hypothetical protein